MLQRKLPLPLMIILTGFLLVQCDNDQIIDDEDGRMIVTMYDEPAEYESVFVEIVSVEVHRDTEDQGSGWITLSDDTTRTDLLELVAGNEEVLADTPLEPGTYRQIRLILGDDNELVIDGESHDLTTPSAQQTGIKLNIDAEIEAGSIYNLELDFDANKSIVPRGATGEFNLKPTIRAVPGEISGEIAGEVEPAEESGLVYAVDATEEDTINTNTDEEGSFLLRGLPDGVWTVTAEVESDDYEDGTVEDVVVELGETTDIGTIELEPVENDNDNGNDNGDDNGND